MITDETTKNAPPWPVRNAFNMGDDYGPGEQIKVRCKDPRGIYYNYIRRREGDVFTLIPMYVTEMDPKTGKVVYEKGRVKKKLVSALDQFSENTMELIEEATPENITTAQQALNKQVKELDDSKVPLKG